MTEAKRRELPEGIREGCQLAVKHGGKSAFRYQNPGDTHVNTSPEPLEEVVAESSAAVPETTAPE